MVFDLNVLMGLVQAFGYAGVFLGSFIGSASVLFPLPSFVFVFFAGSTLNPLIVGILAGLGSAIGELTGYGVGYGIRHAKNKLSKKKNKKEKLWMKKFHELFHKRLGFLTILFFAMTPLPDDLIGIFCGIIHYDIKKFFLAVLIGKIILSLILAYAGFYGITTILQYF